MVWFLKFTIFCVEEPYNQGCGSGSGFNDFMDLDQDWQSRSRILGLENEEKYQLFSQILITERYEIVHTTNILDFINVDFKTLKQLCNPFDTTQYFDETCVYRICINFTRIS
jgi:hypothetical protein